MAPSGTDVAIMVAVAALTSAGAPLNDMMFRAGVGLNPLPKMETVVPGRPAFGLTSVMATAPGNSAALTRRIARRFPTASYSYVLTSPDAFTTAIKRFRSS